MVRATPDGYVVGRALVDVAAVEWLSPTHVRPHHKNLPTDVRIPAMKQGAVGGQVELKPARLAKGRPVPTQVGVEVIFGEALDATALRASRELKAIFAAMVKSRRTYWRHLCTAKITVTGADEWFTLRSTPHGEACECGATEAKRSAA